MQTKDSCFRQFSQDKVINASKEITCALRKHQISENQITVEFVFGRNYPLGSAGNPHAVVMESYITKTFEKVKPAAVIFNLKEPDYRCGDGLAALFWALRDKSKKKLTIQKLYGHSSPMVTQRYLHPDDEIRKEAVELLSYSPKRTKNWDNLLRPCDMSESVEKDEDVNPSISVH